VIYERLKKALNLKNEMDLSFPLIFLMSSIGKIAATLATYPIITIRVRQQAAKGNSSKKKQNWNILDLY